MRKIVFLLILSTVCAFFSYSDDQIELRKVGQQHDHLEHYAIADMPDAVYYDEVAQVIIIEADGTSLYYFVEIVSDYLNQTVISTQISGYGDTIDVSSLPTGNYTIVITTEFLNEYEGQFSI